MIVEIEFFEMKGTIIIEQIVPEIYIALEPKRMHGRGLSMKEFNPSMLPIPYDTVVFKYVRTDFAPMFPINPRDYGMSPAAEALASRRPHYHFSHFIPAHQDA